MKKIIFATLFVLISLSVIAQRIEIKENTLYTTMTDGAGKDVPVLFKISQNTIDSIKKSSDYAGAKKDSVFIGTWIGKKKYKDTLALHLMSTINGSAFLV